MSFGPSCRIWLRVVALMVGHVDALVCEQGRLSFTIEVGRRGGV